MHATEFENLFYGCLGEAAKTTSLELAMRISHGFDVIQDITLSRQNTPYSQRIETVVGFGGSERRHCLLFFG
jgi:hypothetical protein